jgi:general secretion pathway protein G
MKLRKMLFAFALCCLAFRLSSFFVAGTTAAELGTPKSLPVEGAVFGPEGKAPIPIAQPLPPYTEEARKARIEGVVVLQAIIRKDGTIDSFKVVKGLGYGLDMSAINTIGAKWRFSPGTVKGAPVDTIANIEVRFRLFDQLIATIFEPRWERSLEGSMNGSGYGNIKDAASLKGFTYTCSCKGTFDAGSNSVKWIEPQSRLEITSYEMDDGNTRNPQKCELKVIMQDFIYEVRDGSLITAPAGTMGQQGQSEIKFAKAHITVIESALEAFAFDMGRWPTTAEGLNALVQNTTDSDSWAGPYLKKAMLLDPWGKPYIYQCPGQHKDGDYDIHSVGHDGIDGNGDDVCSWK